MTLQIEKHTQFNLSWVEQKHHAQNIKDKTTLTGTYAIQGSGDQSFIRLVKGDDTTNTKLLQTRNILRKWNSTQQKKLKKSINTKHVKTKITQQTVLKNP